MSAHYFNLFGICMFALLHWCACISSNKQNGVYGTKKSDTGANGKSLGMRSIRLIASCHIACVPRDNSKTSFGLENVARLLRIMQANENLGGLATQVGALLRREKDTIGKRFRSSG